MRGDFFGAPEPGQLRRRGLFGTVLGGSGAVASLVGAGTGTIYRNFRRRPLYGRVALRSAYPWAKLSAS